MGSGMLDAEEEARERERERQRWGDGNRFYTRKIRRGLKNKTRTDTPSSFLDDRTVTSTTNDGTATTAIATAENNGTSISALANGTSGEPAESNNQQNDSATIPQQSSQTLATEKGDSFLQQQAQPQIEVFSNDSSEPNLQREVAEAAAPPDSSVAPPESSAPGDGSVANGFVKPLPKPIITKVDDKIRINLEQKSKTDIRQLKRKLVTELDQVRNSVRRLDSKVVELTTTIDGVGGLVLPPYFGNDGRSLMRNHSELYPTSNGRALMRMSSDVGSVVHHTPRPFPHLSVMVTENNHGVREFVEKEKRTPKANPYYQNSEFLLGKDRLPSESNKKPKSNGGRKRGREAGYGFGIEKCISQSFKHCNNLLTRLLKHKNAWVFDKPVDAQAMSLHDYHDIIKKPMDLGTIKSKMSKNMYKTPMEFAEDVRLTFHNAMTYNPKGHEVHVMAEEFLKIFEDKWVTIEADYRGVDWTYGVVNDMGMPTPTSRIVPHPSAALDPRTLQRSESMTIPFDPKLKPSAPVGRTPVPKKPKANDPHKRNMTYEEKQRLSKNLQTLPLEKLDNIVQIIKKRNSDLSQHDDEIEVDIDSVDAETLWELDRFVTNYKKSLSKNRRRAELARARAEAIPPISATNQVPGIVETQKHPSTGEKNLTTAPALGDRIGANGSDSSSSSSSSSDSGSSSSDSDSDSSSGYGSDAGQSPKAQ